MAASLTGPRKSGRSLLARIFAAKSGGGAVDDAERQTENDAVPRLERARRRSAARW